MGSGGSVPLQANSGENALPLYAKSLQDRDLTLGLLNQEEW